MKRTGVVLSLALLAACGGGRPPVVVPTPPPTPVPTPTPSMPLLKVAGNQFVPPILGSVTTHHGWPLVDATALDAIAGSGLNYTAMRVPCELDDRPGYDVYQRGPGGDKADLAKFNPAFDALLSRTLEHAMKKGIYVNLGLWDGWCAVHVRELKQPLKAAHNVNGVDLGTCEDFRRAPDVVIQAQVNHVVSVAAKFPNVIWELGNEANRCQPSAEFVDGIRQVVRTAEAAAGSGRHLWSPGTWNGGELGGQFDYVSQHDQPAPAAAHPIEVNEFSPQDRPTYLANLARAKQLGTVYHYWHDDPPGRNIPWDDPAWEQEWLDTMALMKKLPTATGCTNIPNEDSVAVKPRPAANPEYADAINAAIQKVIPGSVVGSTVEIKEGMQSFFAKVTEEIRKGGLCAGVQTDTEGLVDQICVGTEKECQGNHIYACVTATGCNTGTVAWAPGSYTNRNCDTWRRP